jgi:hypothetical protein
MRLGRRVVKQGGLMIWQEASSEWVQRHVLLLNDAWMCFSSSEAGLILEENASLTEVAVDVQVRRPTAPLSAPFLPSFSLFCSLLIYCPVIFLILS